MGLLTRSNLWNVYINMCDKVIWTSHDADVMATRFRDKTINTLCISQTTLKTCVKLIYVTEK